MSYLVRLAYCITALKIVAAVSSAIQYSDCGCEKGEVFSVHITGCNNLVCDLVKGIDKYIKIKFKPSENVNNVTASTHWKFFSSLFPVPMNSNACKESGLTCPLKKGHNYTYKSQIGFVTRYLINKVTIKYQLKDSEGIDIVCVELPSNVTNSKGK